MAKITFPAEWAFPRKRITEAHKAIDKLNVLCRSPLSVLQGLSIRQFRELDNAAVEVVRELSIRTIGELVEPLRSNVDSESVLKEILRYRFILGDGNQ